MRAPRRFHCGYWRWWRQWCSQRKPSFPTLVAILVLALILVSLQRDVRLLSNVTSTRTPTAMQAGHEPFLLGENTTTPQPSSSLPDTLAQKNNMKNQTRAQSSSASNVILFPDSEDLAIRQKIQARQLLLSVPFYVYHDLAWVNATLGSGNDTILLSDALMGHRHHHLHHHHDHEDHPVVGNKHRSNSSSSTIASTKHLNDYWMMLAALDHPMRTYNASEAQLFVIPTLFNVYAKSIVNHLHYKQVMQEQQRLEKESRAHRPSPNNNNSNNSNSSIVPRKLFPLCWNGMCGRQLMQYTTRLLLGSDGTTTTNKTTSELTLLQKYPERHLLTLSHFFYKPKTRNRLRLPKGLVKHVLSESHIVSFEQQVWNRPERMRLPSYLVGTGCDENVDETTATTTTTMTRKTASDLHNEIGKDNRPTRPHDVVMVATLKPNDPRFSDRSWICRSLHTPTTPNRYLNNTNIVDENKNAVSMPICGTPPPPTTTTHSESSHCPHLAHAKLGFHVRGDTWGSQRLMDLLLSGTVPIFTDPQQYKVLPQWVNWSHLSYLVDLGEIRQRAELLLMMRQVGTDILYNTTNTSTTSRSDMEKVMDRLLGAAVQDILRNKTDYTCKQQTIWDHRHLFDWRHGLYPFDTYMFVLQQRLGL